MAAKAKEAKAQLGSENSVDALDTLVSGDNNNNNNNNNNNRRGQKGLVKIFFFRR